MVRRTLTLLVALFAVALFGVTPAHAGGPTSVLLSAPPHVIAFGYEDRAYGELQRLTDSAASRKAPSTEEHSSGHFIRATWLIHDMSVWRIDIIYPDAPGGPWIATTDSMATGTMPEQPTWHTAADPVALVKLLDSLKLLNGQTFDGGPTTLDYAPPTPELVTAQAPAPVAAVAETGIFTGWRWIIPGTLVGAAAAFLALRLLPKRRWDLIDAE